MRNHTGNEKRLYQLSAAFIGFGMTLLGLACLLFTRLEASGTAQLAFFSADPIQSEYELISLEMEHISDYLSHEVRYNHETMSLIAAWYTGSADKWQRIAAVNPEVNPHLIHPGQVIRIPRELITKASPLPRPVGEEGLQAVVSKQPAWQQATETSLQPARL